MEGERSRASPHLGVVSAGVVQQREADVVQTLDLAGVVGEALEGPAADIPRPQQAALDLSCPKTNDNSTSPGLPNQDRPNTFASPQLNYSQVEAVTNSI